MKKILHLCFVLVVCCAAYGQKTTINVNQYFDSDTALMVLNSRGAISGLSVDMRITRTSPRFLVRLVLEDNNQKQYLIAESYREIAGDGEIVQAKVDKINAYNNAHQRLWTAGVTQLSLMTLEERMRALGFDVSDDTGGFEYYAGGIFEVGDPEEYVQNPTRTNSFVDEFDWTDRHGKNWMTSIKGQGYSNYCAAFTGVACAEALTNLYYNQKIDLDLSELEAANCCGSSHNTYKYGTLNSYIAGFLRNTGVCDENSYPFLDDPNDTICRSNQINPQYRVQVNNYIKTPDNQYHYEDTIKKLIINYGPLLSGFYVDIDPGSNNDARSHAMALVGYGTIHAGDSIRIISSGPDYSTPSSLSAYYVVPDTSSLIGRTYFKFKNSNNIRPNDDVDGYMHIMFHQLFRIRRYFG